MAMHAGLVAGGTSTVDRRTERPHDDRGALRHGFAEVVGTVSRRPHLVGVGALVVLPFVVLAIVLLGRAWTPAGDIALEMLQVSEVGGRHTPLVGTWSRWGWNHPGPLLFYVLAPFTWLLGDVGALVGVVVCNAAAALGAVLVADRRGGPRLAVLTGLVALALGLSLGPAVLISPWNPWVGLLPLLCVVLLAWSIAERDLVLLPVLVGVGSFIVQAHVGFAPLVIGLSIAGAALAWRRADRFGYWPRHGRRTGMRRPLLVSAIVGLLLWLPPIIDQIIRRPGNLSLLLDFVRDPAAPAAGWRAGWRVMTAALGFPGAWLSGTVLDASGRSASPLPALILLAAVAALGLLAARRGAAGAARLAALSLAATLVGLVATARVVGPVFDYLLRFWWIIGASLWLSVAWSVVSLTRARLVVPAGLAIMTVLSAGLTWRAVSVEVPERPSGDAVRSLGDQLATGLDHDTGYVLEWADRRTFGGTAMGVFLDLHDRGFDVAAPLQYDMWFDSWHLRDRDTAEAILTVVGQDDLDAGTTPPPDAVTVARYDPLDPTQRARAEQLWQAITSAVDPAAGTGPSDLDSAAGRQALVDAGADKATVEALAALHERGAFAYAVYLSHG